MEVVKDGPKLPTESLPKQCIDKAQKIEILVNFKLKLNFLKPLI